MENPLAKFVEVESRSDGVYIKVTRKQRDTISVNEMIRALHSAMVTNFDAKQVEEIVKRARGGFERVGPPFEYYNPAFDTFVDVKTSPLEAVMRFSSVALTEGVRPTESSLVFALERKGIKYGILEGAVRRFATEPEYDMDIVVARGKPPSPGVEAEVEFQVSVDHDAKPTVDSRGKVDYRNIQSFTAVQKGQVLARRIPPRPGQPGMSVTGEEIPAPEGKDVNLPRGRNTEISEDGLYLVASDPGVVFVESGQVHVGELLHIKGDVDFSVGNIKYSGDVVIRGSVCPGFSVESEGNIEIGGDVESARVVSRNGTIEVKRGVIGKNDTYINGRLGVHLGFAQDATIVSDGTIAVDKHLLHCTVTCNALETSHNDSGIVGGEIRAFNHITSANVGNDSNVHTKLCLVNKEKLEAEEKIKELRELKQKIEKQIEPLARDLKGKSAIMKKAGAKISDKHRQELKKLIDSYNSFGQKVKYIDTKVDELRRVMETSTGTEGYVKIARDVHPGTELSLYGVAHKSIDVRMSSKLFRTDKGEVRID